MKIRTFSPRPAHVRGVAGSRISGDVPNSGVSRKTPQKASECYQNVEKAPKNSTEFLHICQKHPKKLPKSSRIFLKYHRTFPFLSKVPKKAPEKLLNSGEISIWHHLWPTVGSPLSDEQIEVCIHMHSYIHIPVCLQTGMWLGSLINSSRQLCIDISLWCVMLCV